MTMKTDNGYASTPRDKRVPPCLAPTLIAGLAANLLQHATRLLA